MILKAQMQIEITRSPRPAKRKAPAKPKQTPELIQKAKSIINLIR